MECKSGIKNNFDKKSHKIYIPINEDKYKGKYPIISRSSWETSFMKWLDYNDQIKKWSSEDISILYQDPLTPIQKNGKIKLRRYYPDFLIQFINGSIWLIEIKPYKETILPRKTKKKSKKTIAEEEKRFRINNAKWRAAENFCKKKGWKFKILTEKELFF